MLASELLRHGYIDFELLGYYNSNNCLLLNKGMA